MLSVEMERTDKRANISVLMFMYKFVTGELPELFSNMYVYQAEFHNYCSRGINDFILPLCRLEIVKLHIRYKVAELWNIC